MLRYEYVWQCVIYLLKIIRHPCTHFRLFFDFFFKMGNCHPSNNRRTQELEHRVENLARTIEDLVKQCYQKTEKLVEAQNENEKLNGKLSELETELEVTHKSLEKQTALTENRNIKLLSCETKLTALQLEKNNQDTEIQILKKQFQDKNEENCNLNNQILKLKASEASFKEKENEYLETISKYQRNRNDSIKQNKTCLEKKIELTKRPTELEKPYRTLEKQSELRSSSQQDLSKKISKSFEFGKSKSHTDLQILKQISTPSIHVEQEWQLHENEANKVLPTQIRILNQQLFEKEHENQTLNLEKFNIETQIHDLQCELSEYKQKVTKPDPEIKIYQAASVTKPQFNRQTNTQVTKAICDEPYVNKRQDIQSEQHYEVLNFEGSVQGNSEVEEYEETVTPNVQLDPYTRQALEKINEIHQDTAKLTKDIEEFSGTKEDKTFLHLNELLMRNIVKLDNVDSEGLQSIREKRKDAIQFVQKLHSDLNNKV